VQDKVFDQTPFLGIETMRATPSPAEAGADPLLGMIGSALMIFVAQYPTYSKVRRPSFSPEKWTLGTI